MISADDLIKKLEKWRAEQPVEYRLVRCGDEVGFINWEKLMNQIMERTEIKLFGKLFRNHIKELREARDGTQ